MGASKVGIIIRFFRDGEQGSLLPSGGCGLVMRTKGAMGCSIQAIVEEEGVPDVIVALVTMVVTRGRGRHDGANDAVALLTEGTTRS